MSLLRSGIVFYYIFLQVRKGTLNIYCEGTLEDNDILIDLCKAPLHFSCSKRSRKLFIDHVEQVQGGRHEKFEKARVELEKIAA